MKGYGSKIILKHSVAYARLAEEEERRDRCVIAEERLYEKLATLTVFVYIIVKKCKNVHGARTRLQTKAVLSAVTHFAAREQTKMFQHGQCEPQAEGKWRQG